jgi:GMP synthase (glutamine-hydrolysing)
MGLMAADTSSTPDAARPRTAVVLVHEESEGPGLLGPALRRAGFALEVRLREPRPSDAAADLLVVMGGPQAAYDTAAHPFLAEEQRLLSQRLAEGRPSLGICLGAQLLAAAAGAKVHPGEKGKVLGVQPVTLTPAGLADPLFAGFEERFEVLHWHGDTYTLPSGAQGLASSARYAQEAFRVGTSYGVQWHPEVDAATFERWVRESPEDLQEVGRKAEEVLARDVPRLERAQQHATLLLERLARFFAREVGAGAAGGERFLFTVQGSARLGGKGVILSPGIPRRTPIIRVGQALSLLRPDGSRVGATVRGMASFGETGSAIPLLVQLDDPEADVPAGSEAVTEAPQEL